MADLYARITEVEPEILEMLMKALEMRATDPQQKAIRDTYFSWLDWPDDFKFRKPAVLREVLVVHDAGGWQELAACVVRQLRRLRRRRHAVPVPQLA